MPVGSRIVAVDLPDAEGWNDEISAQAIFHLRANILKLQDAGYDAHLIEGDSHSETVIEGAKNLGPYEVVFIDGDHSYEGVSQDWRNYGGMGKKILFHDIREPRPPEWMGLGVWKLWREIKAFSQIKKHLSIAEFLADGSKMGIGKVELE